MIKKLLLLSLLLTCIIGVEANNYSDGYPQTDRTKISLNADWKFHLGDPDAEYYRTNTADNDWETVSVPHTLELTDLRINGYDDTTKQPNFMRNVGWYRKSIYVPNSDKKVYLEFEGVHQVTTLWVNGREVGVHSVGGYTPFNFDITAYVKRGAENQVTILADNRVCLVTPPDPGPFDYVKFSGLYRDLYLVEKNQLHITSNLESMYSGVTITTPSVDCVNGNATIDIRTEIRNESKKSQKATLSQRIVDAEGNVVLKLNETVDIAAGATYRFSQIGGVDDNVKFWSIENPYLYKINTTLYNEAGEAIDVVDNRLGLRKIEYDHETGFKLNGKNIELIGFNRHQQFAYIGDAMPNSLHYRDMIQFKNLGVNCMRTAHYPHDDEVIKACDELGILVYEEAPSWISISTEKEWFENERKATQAMIRNHKNSPSIFIWGAGINHRGAVAEAQFVVKQEDPTRLTASQNSRWTGWQNSSWTDIFANMNYAAGIWSREEPLLAMEGWFGPEALAQYFRDPMMPGMFSWTGHAYYTFQTFDFDNSMELRTRLGVMDAFRYTKEDDLFWYPAELKSEPYIHIRNDWSEDLEMITVYSNATQIELFVNGESIGRYLPSRDLKYNGLSHAPFEIKDFDYEDGELKAVGYRDGVVMAECSTHTPTEATKLHLIAHQYDIDFLADGNDILVVHAEVVDKNGIRIRNFEGMIEYSVDGDATIVGDEIEEGFNPVIVRNGVGSALIRAGKNAGKVKVSATCSGLSSASITVETVAAEVDRMAADSYYIKDRESIMVDMGGDGQLAQFGWTSWIDSEENASTTSILPSKLTNYVAGDTPSTTDSSEIVDSSTDGAYTFTIETNSANGILRWLGEMNIIGKNNFVYGDGVLGIDENGISLIMHDLPAGDYQIRSYHHAPGSNTNEMDPNLERLKSESIHKLPYAKTISVGVDGEVKSKRVKITSGTTQQYADPTIVTTKFTVENSGDSVKVIFKSLDQNPGVWLNGFEFVRFL